jgi:hypothetical protein
MRALLRDNGLSAVFGLLFLGALTAQSFAGWHVEQHEATEHGQAAPTYWHYVTSSSFGRAVLENWQSEYLQFFLFILLTIWFVQLGSPESKELDKPGLESDEEQRVGPHAPADAPRWAVLGGWRRALYSWSLLIVMAAFFLLSWFGHSVTGWTQYNDQQAEHGQPGVSWLGFVSSADFWEQTLQNWQSEFLAVGTFSIFAVFLRQRGSPESKPVGAAHDETGTTG